MEEAHLRLTDRYTEPLRLAYEKYLCEISPENAKGVRIDAKDLSLYAERAGEYRNTDYFSSGTAAIFDVCMRLALIETAYKDNLPFLVLDDPFVSLDDENAKKALELLKKLSSEIQILYFTCHSSRVLPR